MGKHRFSRFLRKLAKETDIEEERAFLRKASHDVCRHSFDRYGFSSKTDRLYEKMCIRNNSNPMRTVFLECCRLPVLVKFGDIVKFREKRKLKYGIVAHVPKYSDRNFGGTCKTKFGKDEFKFLRKKQFLITEVILCVL